ncbi:unnamed protein product [Eruca vesicaria subsp. sativa]|uniref:apyrase n=1 Tax=Eruca vesicaria subsp. sativa TaxID=29727 RepID=A0ABC8KTR7_ERUVS|nr:unnamed protein product [Eruca vesicaria subsp. sativa]
MVEDPLMVQILPDQPSSYTFSKTKSKSILLLIITTTLGLLFVVFYSNIELSSSGWNVKSSFRYSVIIDAGSSGTRVHLFRYWIESGKPVFDFGEVNYLSLKLTPGLSAYADNPVEANTMVAHLVDFAKIFIPVGVLKVTDIRLMATAGMRLLNETVQQQILEVTRKVLRSSGFMFRDEWASVISGSDEGIYAWVIANYALGSLGGDPFQTTGIVELGGASAQVTFVSSEFVPPEFSRTISYGNVAYKIYSHSFLHYGQDTAQEDLYKSLQNSGKGTVIDPCTPKGYTAGKKSLNDSFGILAEESRLTATVQAAGNFSQCRSLTFAMLQKGKENCPYKHCSIGSTFTPNLQGKFLAKEQFYHTSKFFELEEKAWLSKMIPAAKSFCGEEWSKLKEKYPTIKDRYLHGYCFSSAYIVSMLHDSLGFALDDERIKFAEKAGAKNTPLDWALGAFILNNAKARYDYGGKSRKNLGFF